MVYVPDNGRRHGIWWRYNVLPPLIDALHQKTPAFCERLQVAGLPDMSVVEQAGAIYLLRLG